MRIQRSGQIRFGDASMDIWESVEQMDWDARVKYERQFKRDVFARIIQTLNRIGFKVTPATYIFTTNNARFCQKGDLKADLRINGRHIELNFFQSVNCPDRPDHEGRYQGQKERHMTYLQRLEMERARRRIRDYLCNVIEGYSFCAPKPSSRRDGMKFIFQAAAELSQFHRCDWMNQPIEKYNSKGANGTLRNGQAVYTHDRYGGYGRLIRGVAYHHINNMWWVLLPSGEVMNVASFEIYIVDLDFIVRRGRIIPQRLALERLSKEKERAIKSENFERAAVLRDLISNSTRCDVARESAQLVTA